MTRFIRLQRLVGGGATVLMVALALGGCGSDDDDDAAAAPDEAGRQDSAAVPPGAAASAQAFHQFLKDLKPSDDSQPLITAEFVPPVSDSEEAVAID